MYLFSLGWDANVRAECHLVISQRLQFVTAVDNDEWVDDDRDTEEAKGARHRGKEYRGGDLSDLWRQGVGVPLQCPQL